METGAIANFLKNSMQELFAGVRGAVAAPRDYVPAIVPVPVSDVNNQFASGTETYKAEDDIKKKEKKETIVEEKTIIPKKKPILKVEKPNKSKFSFFSSAEAAIPDDKQEIEVNAKKFLEKDISIKDAVETEKFGFQKVVNLIPPNVNTVQSFFSVNPQLKSIPTPKQSYSSGTSPLIIRSGEIPTSVD